MRGKAKRTPRGPGDADGYRAAMDAALRLIAYRPRTSREIETRLKEKGFDAALAGKVRRRLFEIGYINDREFALAWIKSRAGGKCRSAWVLKGELREKGIDAELAEEMVESLYSRDRAFRDACELVRRRAGRVPDANREKVKNRLQNLLLRRGFSYDFIREVLTDVLDER